MVEKARILEILDAFQAYLNAEKRVHSMIKDFLDDWYKETD